MAGLEAIVREAAAGYTVIGQEFSYHELNQLASIYDPLRDAAIPNRVILTPGRSYSLTRDCESYPRRAMADDR